jgi:hypothetical protein
MKNVGGGPSSVPLVIRESVGALRPSVERASVPGSSTPGQQWLPRGASAESSSDGDSGGDETPVEERLQTRGHSRRAKRLRS